MKILAIDTSAKAASACIAQEDKIIGEFFINTSLTHSQTLMPMIEQLCKNAQVPISEIEAVAVNAGPGSFTGVRIGVAAAKGLAFDKSLPCVAVSTLESMAYNALGSDCVVCAVMDARCSQVYNALFRVSGEKIERLCSDRALSLTDLEQDLKAYGGEKIMLIGDGAEITFEFLRNSLSNVILAPVNIRIQKASSTALAAFKRISEGELTTDEKLMPAYLRLPQAQRELNKRMGVTK
ncbi:MAG: tRNA (adenosine(37)-N6)-threonylcarbamoyltransferase complex dimerization subunit type 1 TsaB [Ruminococcus sp.]|nr:tRNA (adenosine(37)-N6)-threonylcarbamoyltransferase complex dimerization subunit type 1 TsaB [Ruminococcus sp.]